jgi:hypothetical protein
MALLTTLGLLASGVNAVDGLLGGRSMVQEATKGLEAFERQDLVNAYENVKPSLDIENTALRRMSEQRANVYDVAAQGNAANALGLISTAEEQLGAKELGLYNQMSKESASYDVMRAQDEASMRSIQEQRDAQDLASLQAELASGRQMISDSVTGLSQMSMAAGLAKEQRLAGLGVDPFLAAKEKIAAGEGSIQDYITTGDFKGYIDNIQGFFKGKGE